MKSSSVYDKKRVSTADGGGATVPGVPGGVSGTTIGTTARRGSLVVKRDTVMSLGAKGANVGAAGGDSDESSHHTLSESSDSDDEDVNKLELCARDSSRYSLEASLLSPSLFDRCFAEIAVVGAQQVPLYFFCICFSTPSL